jgi:shikimate kinase
MLVVWLGLRAAQAAASVVEAAAAGLIQDKRHNTLPQGSGMRSSSAAKLAIRRLTVMQTTRG